MIIDQWNNGGFAAGAPMAQMEKMDENEAREKISKGISITDPTGHKVVLDQNLLNHWDSTGDSEATRKERKDRLEIPTS